MYDIKLGKYEVEVGQGPVELDLDDLFIISDDTTEEFKKQPSIYAYVAMLAARAEAVWLDAKRQLEDADAVASKKVRKMLSHSDEKVTEPLVRAEIILQEEYSKAVEYELAVHEQYLILKVLSNSLEQRAQMLISLGAQLRAEANQTGMLIKNTKDKLDEIRQHYGKEDTKKIAGTARSLLTRAKTSATRASGSKTLYGTDPKDTPF